MAAPRIDSHQHFWRYSQREYDWIDDSMTALRRDFLPTDLRPLLDAAAIDGCLAVQARQTLAETRFLLTLAKDAPWIRGVIGWVDLRSSDVDEQLEQLDADDRLVGVRHIAQAEPDDFLTGEAFGRGMAQLGDRGLTYDVLVFPRQLAAATELVGRLPNQRFVLDHLAKPDLRRGELAAWEAGLQALARAPNVACKLSGLVTEADWQSWTSEALRPVFDTVLAAFGPERLLFGSDWPVCLCASSYELWHGTVAAWLDELTGTESAAIMGGNCSSWYPRIANP